ncbi:(d)CMP kinase [Micavibrio aeruginosavorus]|uniref:Cytidylate kinase n=1 Tax=Micavibrio aeruginosavorus EPB TaxID=349215 RepID=M4VET7_9BACT|nr:(d)CMP kinase [Micavibrio aeruginosavorus]AGH96980.1 Cytidylate kinase [Micavibrio aeruginosavorus EPB]
MTTPTPIIAIDGTAASGKGTLARRLADALGFAYLDTGTLYRKVAVDVLAAGGDPADEATAIQAAQNLQKNLDLQSLKDPAIRTAQAGKYASVVAAITGVRTALIDLQRGFAAHPPALADGSPAKGAILDGRDITTFICPDAPVKFYVDAAVDTRAARRHKELRGNGEAIEFEQVLDDMKIRDARDMGRKDAPMMIAPDAIVIDTTTMGVEAVVALAMEHVRKALPDR